MASFEITGGHRLQGTIQPQGAKNEALQVLCAALLTDEPVTYHQVPDILDVNTLLDLLKDLGVRVERPGPGQVRLQAQSIRADYFASDDFARKSGRLRGAVMLAGPLLARFRQAQIPQPGGDKIGRRRLDTHIRALEKLGVAFHFDARHHHFSLDGKGMKAADLL